MNDQGNPMQSIVYKGKLIQFSRYMNPGNESHLTSICDNYFKTKELHEATI